MHYLYSIVLFSLFFGWSYALQQIAYFLIHHRFEKHGLNFYQQIPDLLLLGVSSLSFYAASCTILPNSPIYFILISALWVTIHSDLRFMLISRFVSLYLIPIAIAATVFKLLPITPVESISCCLLSAIFLLTVNKIFSMLKGHDGLGQGDIELIACIGSWIGFLGTWFTILVGSVVGTLCGCIYIIITRSQIKVIPFGPFLASACLLFIIGQNYILQLLLTHLI